MTTYVFGSDISFLNAQSKNIRSVTFQLQFLYI